MLKIKLLLSSICLSMLLTVGVSMAETKTKPIIPQCPVVLDGVFYETADYKKLVEVEKIEVKHFVLTEKAEEGKFIYAFTTNKDRIDFMGKIDKNNRNKVGNYKAIFWTKPNFKGKKLVLRHGEDRAILSGRFNNEIESLKVGKKARWVILFDYINYQGPTLSIRSNLKISNLISFNWANRASSIKTGEITLP